MLVALVIQTHETLNPGRRTLDHEALDPKPHRRNPQTLKRRSEIFCLDSKAQKLLTPTTLKEQKGVGVN